VINPLTVKQAAAVARVPVLNVSRARRNGHNGERAGNGVAALVAALHDGTDAKRGKVVRTIGEFLLRMTPTDRIDTARAVGVDWIWDHMIAPVIAEERVSQQAAE
jgi:hypothetical protein